MTLKIGINGLGRIGRNRLRTAIKTFSDNEGRYANLCLERVRVQGAWR